REPLAAGQCAAILRIPSKRAPKRSVSYLESEELSVLLNQPDRNSKLGQRDHTLLALLYNSGARISEALRLCRRDIRLDAPPQIRLYGKGRKERICPLWPETANLLVAFLRHNAAGPEEPIFRNRYGEPLGAAGARFRLRQYVQSAAQSAPRLTDKRVSPHTLRHTAAVHLIASGVDVTVVQSWMGHASLDTTYIYAQANLETKRKAIEKVDSKLRPGKAPRWKKEPALMDWLDSL